MSNQILEGDCLKVLKTLESESVDCCITSPPYFALRDYGTGEWKGGDPECKHVMPRNKTRMGNGTHKQSTNVASQPDVWTTCGLCGAVKEDLQIGLEESPDAFIAKMVEVFEEVRRVLKKEGTLWLNLGDTYSADRWSDSAGSNLNSTGKNKEWSGLAHKKGSGLPAKNLMGMPWRVALALQAAGWILRQDIIWSKPNPMPESVDDRCTKSHEYVFLMAKSPDYFYDQDAVRERTGNEASVEEYENADGRFHTHADDLGMGMMQKHPATFKAMTHPLGRNRRSVWNVAARAFKDAHFATFPEKLIMPMIKAGCPKDGIVLDPFIGSGTTGVVAVKLGRKYLGIELNPAYVEMARSRIGAVERQPMLV